MVAPERSRCGVADYTGYLLEELASRVDVAYVTDAGKFRPEMNAVDLIHVQHQYFLFGGVAPWKNWFGRFARSLKTPSVMTIHEYVPPRGSLPRRIAVASTNRAQFRQPSIRKLIVHTAADAD